MTKIILLQNTIYKGVRYGAGVALELEEEVAKHFVEAKLGYQPEDVESSENTEQAEVEQATNQASEQVSDQADGEGETQTEEIAGEKEEETADVEQADVAKNGNKKGKK